MLPLKLILNVSALVVLLLLTVTTEADGNSNTSNIEPINDDEFETASSGSGSSSVHISDWMLTTFIVAGIVVTFWALCICGLAICLLRLYYARRKKEILIKRTVESKLNSNSNDNVHTKNININEDGDGETSKTGGRSTITINGKNMQSHQAIHRVYDSTTTAPTMTMTMTQTTLNTEKIFQQTDGMETCNIDMVIAESGDEYEHQRQIMAEIEESRESDDDIYGAPPDDVNLNKLNKKKKKKKRKKKKKKKINGGNNNNNNNKEQEEKQKRERELKREREREEEKAEQHIHTQSINMEESHDRGQSSLTIGGYSSFGRTHSGKKHTIISDHNTYPSIPSVGMSPEHIHNNTNPHIPIHNSQISAVSHGIRNTPSSLATSYIYENCATPDGVVFNSTAGIGVLHHHHPINPDTISSVQQSFQLPKYKITKQQWM